MLTAIFANRYRDYRLFPDFTEPERRLLVQCFRLMVEQLHPADESSFWSELHSRLAMELGLEKLWTPIHKLAGSRQVLNIREMCRQFTLREFDQRWDSETYVKDRLSFVELGFRKKGEEVQTANSTLGAHIRNHDATLAVLGGLAAHAVVSSKASDSLRAANAHLNTAFDYTVRELNERLRQAGAPLHYHNGFFQLAGDALTTDQIQQPFWSAVAGGRWATVDMDMKEAVDTRDNGGRDPAWYAARALESAIKIISAAKGWSTGKERGAHNYVENITKNGLIETWEADQLKGFFTNIRNDFGHGPGENPMPELTPVQTDWVIEFTMSWIKTLVRRSGL
jgi:AbiJ N-terminal domain 4